MKTEIIKLLEKQILEKYNLEKKDLKLEIPPKKELWDFAFGWFQLARDLKKNPNLIVEELKKQLDSLDDEIIEETSIVWLYLNIKVNKKNILKKYFSLEKNFPKKNKTIVIDYIWANVWKPMHIGHMCTPNQGQAMINVYKKLWYNVISDSHIGDWWIIFGKLILAYKNWGDEKKLKQNAVEHLLELYIKITAEVEDRKKMIKWLIWDILIKNKNKENWLETINFFWKPNLLWKTFIETLSEDLIIHEFNNLVLFNKIDNGKIDKILNLYNKDKTFIGFNYPLISLEEQIRNEFKKLSSWDKDSIKLWASFTKESIKAMNKQLWRMNVKPDYNIWESFYEGLNLPKMEDYPDLEYSMKDIVKELIEKKIATKNEDNSVWVIFDEETKIPSCILQKRDWTHWYLASDLAAIKYRVINWNPEKIIYFVDSRQQLHLKQAFEISKNAGWINKEKLFHAYNWFISLKDWAMSTRKGRIIKLDKLLDEAEKRAKKIILEKRDDISGEDLEKLAKIIWIWAIKYWYLKKNRETDVVFDWDEFMSFEGNSWPYIQYAYVRARKILEKANIDFENIDLEKINESELKDETLHIVKYLMKYKDILEETAEKNMPHILANYAYELTKLFNNFYNNVEVLNTKDENLKKLRLKIVDDFSKNLKESFNLLAIDMPEKM